MSLIEAVHAAGTRAGKSKTRTSSAAKQEEKLTRLYEEFAAPADFKPGDLIELKDPELSMWTTTSREHVLVVLEVIENPLYGFEMGEVETGYPHASMKFDIICGSLGNEADTMLQGFYDSRRFKKYKRAAASNVTPLKSSR